MFADDICVIAQDLTQVREATAVIHKWCEAYNMNINKKKSGIMLFGIHHPSREIEKIPIVQSYRYLGSQITPKLNLMDHVNAMIPKFHFIRTQLLPILLKNHFRLNVNLYTVFIDPLLRLIYPLYSLTTDGDKAQFQKKCRYLFKTFVSLPRSTPNLLVADFIGNIDRTASLKCMVSDAH